MLPSTRLKRLSKSRLCRIKSTKEVCEAIRKVFEQSKETYGSPRVYSDLRDQGILVSESTVAKYMQEMGLDARLKKRFRIQTTDSDHSHLIARRTRQASRWGHRISAVEREFSLPIRSLGSLQSRGGGMVHRAESGYDARSECPGYCDEESGFRITTTPTWSRGLLQKKRKETFFHWLSQSTEVSRIEPRAINLSSFSGELRREPIAMRRKGK